MINATRSIDPGQHPSTSRSSPASPWDNISEASETHLIRYREALSWCEPRIVDQAMNYGKHYDDGDGAGVYWFAAEFREILEMVAIEMTGGIG